MNESRWTATNDYLDGVFGREDQLLTNLRDSARQAGLPSIEVSAAVGRLLQLLVVTTPARTVLEVGTLGGYSTIWLARAVPSGSRVITIEHEPRHAAFARRWIEAAGLDEIVEVWDGDGHEMVQAFAADVGSVDFAFVDADKEGYPDYWLRLRELVSPGGLVVFDNALGTGSTWIDAIDGPSIRATDETNRMVAGDPDFDAALVPLREGLLIARRR